MIKNNKKGYMRVFIDIMRDPDLSWEEAVFLGYLQNVYPVLDLHRTFDGKEYGRLSDSFVQGMYKSKSAKKGGVVSNPTIKKWLDSLKAYGYIETKTITSNERWVRLTDEFYDEFGDKTDNEINDETYDKTYDKKIFQQNILNNSNNSNTLNKKNNESKDSASSKKKSKKRNTDEFLEQEYEVIDYFNLVTNSNYKKSSTSTFRKLLRKLFEEGFTLEDFKTVIDKKTLDWRGTPYEQYLNPHTLFGEKFETYLRSKIVPKKNNQPSYRINKEEPREESKKAVFYY